MRFKNNRVRVRVRVGIKVGRCVPQKSRGWCGFNKVEGSSGSITRHLLQGSHHMPRKYLFLSRVLSRVLSLVLSRVESQIGLQDWVTVRAGLR